MLKRTIFLSYFRILLFRQLYRKEIRSIYKETSVFLSKSLCKKLSRSIIWNRNFLTEIRFENEFNFTTWKRRNRCVQRFLRNLPLRVARGAEYSRIRSKALNGSKRHDSGPRIAERIHSPRPSSCTRNNSIARMYSNRLADSRDRAIRP